MKKQLLFNFRMAAFAALTLLTAQSSFAQTTYTWGGATSTDFLDGTNWNAVPDFSLITNSFTIPTGTTNSPILGADYPSLNNTCAVILVNTGASLATNGNITTSTSTNTVNGTLNVNGGTFKSRLYIGNGAATTAVVNVATGATLSGVGVWRISVDATPTTPGTLNVNGGTYEMTTGSSLTIGGVSAARKGILNINTGLVKFTGTATLSLGNAGTTATGTVNQAGGSLGYN
ncbi:MAG: hypothetical protein KA133_07925, partial [Flavobacterium sp.]|nr:hypothetical protein [Flavobacterium sp.]